MFAYTANMKRIIPFLITVIISILIGLVVATNQKNATIHRLLSSPSTVEQMKGIALVEHLTFDELKSHVTPLLAYNTDASTLAQQVLIKKAFDENRIQDLNNVEIDQDLYEAALWWSNPTKKSGFTTLTRNIAIKSFNPSPWVMKLMAHYDLLHGGASYPDLLKLPLRDRDGSVLLSVLAIENVAPQKIESLLDAWSFDYDIDRQKAAVFLAAMRALPQPIVSTQDDSLSAIQKIIAEKNVELAWRTLHRKDGNVDPDTMLAGMIISKKKFTPILIKSVQDGKWTHPEHAILIAETFFPNITNQISFELVQNPKTRLKWWALFSCGLLKEER